MSPISMAIGPGELLLDVAPSAELSPSGSVGPLKGAVDGGLASSLPDRDANHLFSLVILPPSAMLTGLGRRLWTIAKADIRRRCTLGMSCVCVF